MAEDRLNDMNAVLQSMQKTLECNICLDLLDKPLTTKCGHSFCAFCIGQCFQKGQSRGVQCPLCLAPVTKRSLGKNEKISSLVIAVREIISSIKKDCCFEITPSKYRQRPRPALEVSPEDNDSENEENDEPRRGSRKRAVPNHYQVVLDVPKPKRGPKQRVLSTHGEQELQLHTGHNSKSSIAERIKSGSPRVAVTCKYEENFDENSEYLDYDHDYYSPSKRQEPVEVSGNIVVKGKGKQADNKVKQRKVAEANVKVKQKTLGKAAPPEGKPVVYSNKNRAAAAVVEDEPESQEHLSEKLGRELPNKKVEKWLNQSREIGFQIGESQSQSVPSEESEASDEDCKNAEKSKGKGRGTAKKSNAGPSNLNSSKKNPKQPIYTNGAASSPNSDMKNQSIKRFLKSKPDDFSESNDYVELQSSQETHVFKPDSSKKGRGGKVQGGSGLSRTRSRGNIRSSSSVVSQRSMNAQADHSRVKEVIIDTSTPKSKYLNGPKTDIDLSLIDPNKIEENTTKSVMRNHHEDLDADFPIPDSCPVNTKDEFDILVDTSRNIESAEISKTTKHGLKVNKIEIGAVDVDDNFYFYQTPPLGDDIDVDMADRYENAPGDSKNHSKKRSHKHVNSEDDDEDYKPTKKSMKTKKREEKQEEPITKVLDQPRSRLRNRVTKSNEDVDAISYAFEEVRKYHHNEDSNEAIDNKRNERGKKKNISMIDETLNNTSMNRNAILSKSLDSHMPPPKTVPSKGRNKNKVEEDKDPSECSRESSWAIKRAFESLTSEVCNAPNDADSLVDSSVKSTGTKGNVRFSSVQTRLVEPRKVEAKAVNIKDTKSPGWSHILGAKKDLKNRHNILNITGCDARNLNDSRTELSSFVEVSQVVLPSSEDSDLIEEADHKVDVQPRNIAKKNKRNMPQNRREIIDNQKNKLDEEEKSDEDEYAEEYTKVGVKDRLKSQRKQQELQSERRICETEPFEIPENRLPNKKIKEIQSSIESGGSSDIIPSSLKSNKGVNPGPSHGMLGQSPASKLSLSRRKTFDLAANIEDLAKSPNSYESKSRHPHYEMSPSIDSEIDKGKQISSNRVPFRSAGPLCSDKCVQAGEEGISFKSLGPDICLHQVPCEVYQVLMKYMDIITQKNQQHVTCCTKKDNESKKGSSPSSSCSKQPSNKYNQEINQDASEVPTQVWHPPQQGEGKYSPKNRMNKPSTNDSNILVKSPIDVKAAENVKDLNDRNEKIFSDDDLDSTGESEPGVQHSQPLFDMKENKENTINVALSDTEIMNIDENKSEEKNYGNVLSLMEDESPTSEFIKQTEKKLLNGYIDEHDTKEQMQQEESLKVFSDSKVVSKELLSHTVLQPAQTFSDGENRYPSSKASSFKQTSISFSTKEKISHSQKNENKYSSTSNVISLSSHMVNGSQEKNNNIKSKEEKNYVNIHSQNSEESQHSTSLLSHPNSSNGTNRSTRSTRNTNIKHTVKENEDKKSQQSGHSKKEKHVNNNAEENDISQVLVEKENLKNIGNVQHTTQSKLGKRKPFQTGLILQENILSQKLVNLKDKSSRIDEMVGSQSSVVVQTAAILSNQMLNPPFASLVQSGNTIQNNNDVDQNERNYNYENIENASINISKDDKNANCSSKINVGSGNYKRIRRPTSDGSSEDSLESEELLHPKKRLVKRIPSSDSNPTPSKSSKDGRTKQLSQEFQQDSEELENLRDMERLDQNVWDYFGRPEDDDTENKELNNSKKKSKNEDDVNIEIIDPSQEIVDVPSQMKELSDLHADDAPMHFEENTHLMDTTQNMAAVMRNLQSDIDLVKNAEEKDNDSDIMEVESSQEGYQQSFIIPSIAASGSHPINKVIKHDKNILDTEESFFETNSISQDPACLKGKANEDEKASKESIASDKKINVPQEVNSNMEDDSSEEFDTEQEDETENMSHSSAHSSQSEEITTQTKKQVEEELANLNAKKIALESRLLQNKNNVDSIVHKEKEISDKHLEESSSMRFVEFSKESIKEHAEEFELDVLPPTCPMEQDPDEDMFGSLPNLSNSTIPLRTVDTKEEAKKDGKCSENQSAVTSSIRETCQDGEQVAKDSTDVKGNFGKSSSIGISIKHQKYPENIQKSINKGYVESEHNTMETSIKNKPNKAYVDQKQSNDFLKSYKDILVDNSNSNNECIKQISVSKVGDTASSSAECASASSSRAKSSSQYLGEEGFGAAVIICTGLTSTEMATVNKFIGTLAPEGTSINKAWSTQVTHVVVKPDEDGQAQRTLKYLYGVAGSRWIVSLQWIYDCLSRNKLLNEDDYEVVDTTGNTGPYLSRISSKPLFHDAEFYLVPPFNDISITQLTELLKLCGAAVVSSTQNFSVNPDGRIMQLVLFQGDGDDDPQVIDGNEYSRLCVAHDWIIECIGTFSHLAIRPYLLCDPSMDQINNSGVSPLLVEETQDIQ